MNVTMAVRFRMSVVMALAMVAGACGSQSMTPDSRSSAGPSSGLENTGVPNPAPSAPVLSDAPRPSEAIGTAVPTGQEPGPSTGSSEPPTSSSNDS